MCIRDSLGAKNVGGHQVRRELNAVTVQSQNGAKGIDQQCFSETRHANKQSMAARKDRCNCKIDDVILTDNLLRDFELHSLQGFCRAFRFGDRIASLFARGVLGDHSIQSSAPLFRVGDPRFKPKFILSIYPTMSQEYRISMVVTELWHSLLHLCCSPQSKPRATYAMLLLSLIHI